MSSSLIRRIRNTPQPSTPALVCSKLGVIILPIAQIAIGAVYMHECPRQPYIPIYLIVAGSFSMLLTILSCLPCARETEGGPPNKLSAICTFWNAITSLFLFAWFITGNVWIYSIYQPNYNKNATDIDSYCNKSLYLFAFWTTTLVYIMLALFVIIGFCVLLCMCLCGRADPDDDV
ncbi:transmembrane protein 272 [Nothobranchius furzeri]|uniref:LOC107377342-like protein n=2 Tax=Nothobranchius TaxID=28779 RepID=A0A1A8AHH7_NOTFU|nr:transmembrane protein 272 [Nothobranchius furzeri]KAF7230262.1 putative LOC107377342-like protein [Nothobranchius furzeri]